MGSPRRFTKLNWHLSNLEICSPQSWRHVALPPSDLMWLSPGSRLFSTWREGFFCLCLWVEKVTFKIVKIVQVSCANWHRWISGPLTSAAMFPFHPAWSWLVVAGPSGKPQGKGFHLNFSFPVMHEEGFKSRSHTTSLASLSAPTRQGGSSWQKWWASARKTWTKTMSCC